MTQSEPAFSRRVTGEALDAALEALGDYVDIKSPYTLGHSRSVAELAARAVSELGMPRVDSTLIRHAGWVHDLGRLGTSNAIWDKDGPLTEPEREQVRLHPYLTQRMLAYSPVLADLGALAVEHHERLDGSGYPHGLRGSSISMLGRVLGAADSYVTKSEPRPHRRALPPDNAAEHLRAEVGLGRLDGDAVDAVLRAAGHRVRRRSRRPSGLTPREIEVLRLVARGATTPQIADQLFIARKTANNHIEHIYAKIGVRNRAQASLFAVTNGLMDS